MDIRNVFISQFCEMELFSSEDSGEDYYPFDFHFDTIACLKLEDGVLANNIHLFNTQDSDSVIDMGVTAAEYLELEYKAKCFKNRQYAYALKDSHYNERLRALLPAIFPFLELNLSAFE